MKYSLRSLMVVAIFGPPLLAMAFRHLETWYVGSLITETGSFDRRSEVPEPTP